MPNNTCSQCSESLDDFSNSFGYNFHVSREHFHSIPLWDSCIRAATGDSMRLIRVHRRMADSEPLLARAYAGDS